jgi:EAL domain-containing protein (putative c-di-GMP-specific phosphodiesterase class I)
LRAGAPDVVVQPILDLASGQVGSYEALSRFADGADPEEWFAAAHRCGLGAALESAAIAAALRTGSERPPGTVLSVNVSPSVLDSPALRAVLPPDLDGLQIEITEHELAEDASALLAALDRFRARGARIAVDDVGQGYAGLKRVMGIRPDVLKLDREIVAGVSREPAKVAMVEAVVHFAARTGAAVCAEGLETVEDLVTAADLDVAQAQGWIVGRPATGFEPASVESRAACSASRAGGMRAPAADGSCRDVAQLLGALAEAGDVREAARRIAAASGLLGCQLVRIAVLRGDVLVTPADRPEPPLPAGMRSIGRPRDLPTVQRLAELPTARLVLAERTMGQVLASTGAGRSGDGELRLLELAGCRSLLMVPLISAGQAVGILECYQAGERAWSRGQMRIARMLAAAAGPVADNLTR